MSKNSANTTKILRNKVLSATTLAMLVVAALIASVPSANATIQVDTTALITAVPNPVGVGQQALITFQIDKTSPTIASISGGAGQDFFAGYTLKITKPDETIENLPPSGSYTATAGSQVTIPYTPDQVGTYTFEFSFPGQTIIATRPSFRWPAGEYYFKPSSGLTKLEVQEEPITGYSKSPPLPTEPWTRPINSENKGWWQVADDWLLPAYDYPTAAPWGQAYWARYASAPDSPHVLWKKPLYFGGIVGGQLGDESFYTGLTYEEFFDPAIIQQGRIIYVDHGPTSSRDTWGTRILDLYTGEELMFLDGITMDFAQNFLYNSANEHGVIPYLWDKNGANWDMYDAFSVRKILSITNVPSGVLQTIGPNGEILLYGFSGTPADRYYWLWNSTKCIGGSPVWHYPNTPGNTYSEEWSPRVGSEIPWIAGIQWNASIPTQTENVIGRETPQFVGQGYQIGDPDSQGFLLAGYVDASDWPQVFVYTAYPAALDKQSDGTYPTSTRHLWTANRTDNYAALGMQKIGYEGIGPDLVFAQYSEDTLKFHGYSIETGIELWQTEPFTNGFAIYTYAYRVANGFLYEGGYDGVLRAYNANNGTLAWEHNQGNAGYETPYGGYPIYTGFTIADGKIYVSTDEHSPDAVMWRGGQLWSVNASTGETQWSMSGWFRRPLIADSILTALNQLDGQLYAIGKGASKTTVTAPQTEVTLGQKIMITGTVTDQTPVSKDTPAISDESMGAWMEYLHMQKSMPTNATGVEVQLDVLDSNNNYYTIGTVTTDLSGSFGFAYEPEIPGSYKVIATFAGSNSYGSSGATTYFNVAEALAATPEPTPTPESIADVYFLPMSIGMIVAIIVVGAVLVLMLRRR